MNLLEFLKDAGIEHFNGSGHRHARAGWIQLDCPYCGKGSGKFHLGVNAQTLRSNCYKCGPHNTVAVLSELSGVSYRQVKTAVSRLEGVETVGKEEVKGTLVVPEGVGELWSAHKRYLRHRGFDPGKVIETWGVRGIGITAALSWRLWIPIHYKGEVVSWTTRGLGSGRSRYMTAKPSQEKMHHKELLYGEDYCDPHRGVIVHEGPIDVWATGEGSVATMGLTYTKAQVLRLAKYPVRAVCFDAEPAASRRASQLATALADFPGTTHIVHLESGKDPAEITFLEREQLRRKFLR